MSSGLSHLLAWAYDSLLEKRPRGASNFWIFTGFSWRLLHCNRTPVPAWWQPVNPWFPDTVMNYQVFLSPVPPALPTFQLCDWLLQSATSSSTAVHRRGWSWELPQPLPMTTCPNNLNVLDEKEKNTCFFLIRDSKTALYWCYVNCKTSVHCK